MQDFHDTYNLRFWLGLYETNDASSIYHYEECLRLVKGNKDTFIVNEATLSLTRLKFKIGEQKIALNTLQKSMISEDRDLRIDAVKTWASLEQNSNKFERLVILCAGLSDKSDSLTILNNLVNLAIENQWNELIAYFSQYASSESSEGYVANNLGRAFAVLKLYSLAYLAYNKAAETGISVAKVNIANLHISKPLPSAGLELLQEHVGDYDAADSGYPYQTRAILEQAVQEERKKAQELYDLGSRHSDRLKYFAWQAIRGSTLAPKNKQVELEAGIATIEVDDEDNLRITSPECGINLEPKKISRTIGLWKSVDKESIIILYCFMENEYMLELTLELTEPSSEPIVKKYSILSISSE